MNDQQLETVLRRSLARHADTVDGGPTWPLADDVLAGHRDRRRLPASWWAVAAAVAAVLAVIGVVLAVRHAASDHSRPATPDTVTRAACATDPPQSWLDAIKAGTLHNPELGRAVVGGGTDGAVLTRYESRASSRTELISPDGSTRIVDERPQPGGNRVGSVSMIDSRWIVLPIVAVASNSQSLGEFEVIDRATLHVAGHVSLPAGNQVRSWALLSGHVYWIDSGRVVDYDIAARQSRTVRPSGAQHLLHSPSGVAWTDTRNATHPIAGARPDEVPGVPGSHPDLVSDGRTYAWLGGSGIAWHDAATAQTVVVQGFPGPGLTVRVLAVVGPYVLIETGNGGPSDWLIDTRTGAAASFQSGGAVAAGSKVLAYSGSAAVILHVDRLPELRC